MQQFLARHGGLAWPGHARGSPVVQDLLSEEGGVVLFLFPQHLALIALPSLLIRLGWLGSRASEQQGSPRKVIMEHSCQRDGTKPQQARVCRREPLQQRGRGREVIGLHKGYKGREQPSRKHGPCHVAQSVANMEVHLKFRTYTQFTTVTLAKLCKVTARLYYSTARKLSRGDRQFAGQPLGVMRRPSGVCRRQ